MEYVDDLGLDRALELIEYIGRRASAQTAGSGRSSVGQTVSKEPAVPLDFDTFSAMQSMGGPIQRMDVGTRGMIDWAEEQLKKGRAS